MCSSDLFRKQLRPTFDQLPLAEKAIWEEYSKIEDGQRQARMKEFYAQFPEVPLKRLVDVGPRPKGLEIEYDFIRTTDSLSMRPRHPPFPKAVSLLRNRAIHYSIHCNFTI